MPGFPKMKRATLVTGKLLFPISEDGTLCTSSDPEFGWATDEYYFVYNSGRTTILKAIQAKAVSYGIEHIASVPLTDGPVATFDNFFVGTE